jgi:undecaprenyl diphosphate synthase
LPSPAIAGKIVANLEENWSIASEHLPHHIAIIMDGNGRWARQRNQPRIFGHQNGAKTVRNIVTECARLNKLQGNPRFLTLYSFSTENWKRPREEVEFLMGMYVQYLQDELPTMMENNIRFNQIGRAEGLPDPVLEQMRHTKEVTAGNTGLTVNLAVNYGGRGEIVDAVQRLAGEVQGGKLTPDQITEESISSRLYTAGQPDPDLLIRTAGEMRISNFLLWQVSYAELYITQTLWPDFDEASLHTALDSFASRTRRFGALR